jgi:hypothetical protein
LVSGKGIVPSTNDALLSPAKLTTNELSKLLTRPPLETKDLEVAVQSLHYPLTSILKSSQATLQESAGLKIQPTMQEYAMVPRPPAQDLLSLVRKNKKLNTFKLPGN